PLPGFSSSTVSMVTLQCSSSNLYVAFLETRPRRVVYERKVILGDEFFDAGTETTHSNVGQTEIYGRRVTVVDTPPWSDTPAQPPPSLDSEGPCMGAILCPPGPHAILLVVSVTQPFTDIHRKAAEEQLGALGGGTWRYSMVVFTGGRELQRLLEYCGNYYHVLDSKTPGKDRSVSVLLDKIEEMIRENGDKAFLPIQTEWCKSSSFSHRYSLQLLNSSSVPKDYPKHNFSLIVVLLGCVLKVLGLGTFVACLPVSPLSSCPCLLLCLWNAGWCYI
uniref:AIG1-type G domain-containing protein n=1 Tax=Gouania willdenowi TaxID=441366 RepID=A0A8C5DWE4_GOUWI